MISKPKISLSDLVINIFCPTGLGGGVKPNCKGSSIAYSHSDTPGGSPAAGSGTGKTPPKPVTVASLKKSIEQLGGEQSTTYMGAASTIGTGSRVSVGKETKSTSGFKVSKGLLPGEIEITFKLGGTYSETVTKKAKKTLETLVEKLKGEGHEVKVYSTTNISVFNPST